MGKLTEAQRRALTTAQQTGGIVGLGISAKTVRILRERGFLSDRKDEYGYYTITPAGRAALSPENGGENHG